ncbi:MAG TPA: hypothetical protein VH599_19705 [Ktedonobacterales bacterium]|jgi:hypothetical protein
MRYAKGILGVVSFGVCVVVGTFIPIGNGSAVVIGAVVGLFLCYLVLSRKRLWFTSSEADGDSGEVNERAIREKTPSIQEAHARDAAIVEQLKNPH